jgi:transposase-like protein
VAKAKKKSRKRYSAEEKAKILEAAKSEKLTAAAVQKKFGVKPVTYYSWRKATKKAGGKKAGGRGRRGRPAGGSGLGGAVRDEVQRRVREVLPGVVRAEVNAYLAEVFRK